MIPRERMESRTTGEPGITVDRPEWQALARCGRNGVLGDDPAVRVRVMYPTDTSSAKVCEGCPVTAECSDLVESLPPSIAHYGTWAGAGQNARDRGSVPCVICGTRFRPKGRRMTCSDECSDERRRRVNLRNQRAVRAGAVR